MSTRAILALRISQDTMQDLRVMLGVRVSPVVKAMIKAEAQARDLSEGAVIDDLVLAACRSPEAMRILSEYARTHPLVVAFHEVQALHDSAADKPSKPAPPKRRVG